jgi:hypothetical protein
MRKILTYWTFMIWAISPAHCSKYVTYPNELCQSAPHVAVNISPADNVLTADCEACRPQEDNDGRHRVHIDPLLVETQPCVHLKNQIIEFFRLNYNFYSKRETYNEPNILWPGDNPDDSRFIILTSLIRKMKNRVRFWHDPAYRAEAYAAVLEVDKSPENLALAYFYALRHNPQEAPTMLTDFAAFIRNPTVYQLPRPAMVNIDDFLSQLSQEEQERSSRRVHYQRHPIEQEAFDTEDWQKTQQKLRQWHDATLNRLYQVAILALCAKALYFAFASL